MKSLTTSAPLKGKSASKQKDADGVYDERNKLNDLTGKEWIKKTKSVWHQQGLGENHEHAQIEHEHPATFAYKDIIKLIEFFTKRGMRVLDPFCGVASTLKACALTGRKGVGIELVPKWIELSKNRLKKEVDDSSGQEIIEGDCRDVLPNFEDESFQYIVTSPPYWSILNKDLDHKTKKRVEQGYDKKYSDDSRDLGNIPSYSKFLDELEKVFKECKRVLQEDKYMTIIVSDFRNNSTYVPFHQDITEHVKMTGLNLQGIIILVQNQKALYPYGYPYAYVPNIHHQYVLTFRKH